MKKVFEECKTEGHINHENRHFAANKPGTRWGVRGSKETTSCCITFIRWIMLDTIEFHRLSFIIFFYVSYSFDMLYIR